MFPASGYFLLRDPLGELGNYLPWISGAFGDNESLGVRGKRKRRPLLLTLFRIHL